MGNVERLPEGGRHATCETEEDWRKSDSMLHRVCFLVAGQCASHTLVSVWLRYVLGFLFILFLCHAFLWAATPCPRQVFVRVGDASPPPEYNGTVSGVSSASLSPSKRRQSTRQSKPPKVHNRSRCDCCGTGAGGGVDRSTGDGVSSIAMLLLFLARAW